MNNLKRVLENAKRLKERGPGSMYPEDEARHLAQDTLDLLIEALGLLIEDETRKPK